MVFRNHTSPPRHFSVQKKTVKTVLILLAIFLCAQWYFVSEHLEQREKLVELAGLKSKLEVTKREASAANSAIEKLRFQLANMKELTTKVREMLGLQQEGFGDTISGQGGEDLSLVIPEIEFPPMTDLSMLSTAKTTLQQELAWLSTDAKVEYRDLRALVETVEQRRARWESTPAIWPVKGWVTSDFGPRRSPFTGLPAKHRGIDIRAKTGTPIVASAAGTVVHRKHDSGFGKVVTLAHGYGISTRYAHLHTMGVKVGQKVKRGEVLGTVGNTGLSTGPHLHYEVIVNKAKVNPMKFIIE